MIVSLLIAGASSLLFSGGDEGGSLLSWHPGQAKPRVVGKANGTVLAVHPSGEWAAGDGKTVRIGTGTRTIRQVRVAASRGVFDGSGKRLALVSAVAGGKFQVVVEEGGRLRTERKLSYEPAWMLWVGNQVVVPGADGALAKAVGPIPAKVPASRAAMSIDGKTCALVTGAPGTFRIIVAAQGSMKSYEAEQSRDIGSLAVDGKAVYYTGVFRKDLGNGNGEYVTPLYQIDSVTGKSKELKVPGFTYISFLATARK